MWTTADAPGASLSGGEGNSSGDGKDPRVQALVESIRSHARALADEIGACDISPTVLDAVARVPRDEFVPKHERILAYADTALPIGHGQTISQPFIVAYMTELLEVSAGDRVLEIGTGSGYQAAVLAELGTQVYSVETIPELAVAAQHKLHALGYENVRVRTGDGHKGWPEHAPYQAIIVTAVADRIPMALTDQLKRDGRLVIPVREPGGEQWLTLIEKDSDGKLHQQRLIRVRFVPLRRA